MLPMKAGLPARALRIVPYLTPGGDPAAVRRLPGAAAGPGRPPHPGALPDRPQDLRGPGPHRGASEPAAGRPGDRRQGQQAPAGGLPGRTHPPPQGLRLRPGPGAGRPPLPGGQEAGLADHRRRGRPRPGWGNAVYPHLFRHSGAIERLRQTGNPRALQLHLGHASPLMTMRYLSTLTAEEALRINQGVRFED